MSCILFDFENLLSTTVFRPMYLFRPIVLWATLQHRAEVRRWGAYVGAGTVFGEQARGMERTGVVDEFSAVRGEGGRGE